MTQKQKLKKALQNLESLGSPGHIAAFLATEGVTGVPGAARRCPLANWLWQKGLSNPSVGLSDVHVWGLFGGGTVKLPTHVSEFRSRFDAGWYTDLLSGGYPR